MMKVRLATLNQKNDSGIYSKTRETGMTDWSFCHIERSEISILLTYLQKCGSFTSFWITSWGEMDSTSQVDDILIVARGKVGC